MLGFNRPSDWLAQPGSLSPFLGGGTGGGGGRGSAQEMLLEDPLFEIGVAVEQRGHDDVAVFVDRDRDDIAHLGKISDGADRALGAFERVDAYACAMRQQRAAPAAGAEGANRGQCQDAGA